MTPKVKCPACRREITAQKWTAYPRRHKNPDGEWCSGVAPVSREAEVQ